MQLVDLKTSRVYICHINRLTFQSKVVTICTTCSNIIPSILAMKSICVFGVVLIISSECYSKQHKPIGLWSGDVMCSLWGTN
jgi:hypothetical protein